MRASRVRSMAPSTSSFFSLLLLSSLYLTVICSLSAAAAAAAAAADHDLDGEDHHFPFEDFPRCFLRSTNSINNGSNLLYTFNSSSYSSIYRSTARNVRFFSMPLTTEPVFIVAPTQTSHVQAAIACGRRHGLHVRVRSGGHDFEGLSFISKGAHFFTLDLRNFRSIDVSAADSTAWVGAGAILGEIYSAIAEASPTLGFPAGVCPTVGAGGHISGGGFGTLLRKYGAAADQVLDAIVVDVDGRILNRESMGEDLFWALRGGGGASFAVILAYKLRLVPVTPTVTVFSINRTLEQGAAALVEKWQHVAPNLDRNVFLFAFVGPAIDDPEAKGNRTVTVNFRCLFLGRRDELVPMLGEAFPELGVNTSDCAEMSWIESTGFFAGVVTDPSKAKSDFVREPIPAEGWKRIFDFMMRSREEPVVMVMNPWKGRMEEVAADAIPFPHRAGNLYQIQHIVVWQQAAGLSKKQTMRTTEMHLRFMRSFYRLMAPYASKNPRAAYFNYKDIDLGSNNEGPETSYSQAHTWAQHYFLGNLQRLAQVKALVDPTNYFWNELSIPPYSDQPI